MNVINFIYSIFDKKLFKCGTISSRGLFYNDLNFFHFEIYFLLALITFLIFFVILSNKKNYRSYYYLNVGGIFSNLLPFVVILLLIILNTNTNDSYYLFAGFYYNDAAVVFFKNIILIGFLIFTFAIKQYLSYFKYYDFEFILVLFISLFSSLLILNSNDLISLFFIIELQSLTFYILVASKQTSSFSTESGLKYFILGCFSSGIILFGISLIYGFTGLLSYTDLTLFLSEVYVTNFILDSSFFSFSGFLIGFLLLTVGFLFKLGSAPFHMWMPDVYEGSPLLITAYLSTLPKISLIFVIFKLYYYVFFEVFLFSQGLFTLTALFSILLGSIAAIYQVKLKRMLTYSMITNTGYLLLGLSFGDISGIYITIFYLISYIFIMIGLFFCFLSLRDRSSGLLVKRINLFSNLLEVNPSLSFSIFILLFSIAGIPPLLGFYSKFFLFLFSLKYKMYWMTILFVIFSVVSVFYYIRLVKLMYFNRTTGWIFLYDIPFLNSLIISFITIINCLFFLTQIFYLNLFIILVFIYTYKNLPWCMFNRIHITVNQLVASDLFLGYHIANWNPRTNFFLIGKYKNTNIFNLNYTYFLAKKFIVFLSELFVNKGHLWLVNENFSLFNRSSELYQLYSLFPEITFLNSKWCKGMLSNYKYVSIVKPAKFPHSIFVPNIQNNHYVINESFIINIPSIAIVDSIDNPSNVFFPIPGNSKSLKSLFFFYMVIAKSLFYSRYITSSKFIFNSINRLNGLNSKLYRNLFVRDYFAFFKKRFLLENIIFLFKSGFFSKKKFNFLFRPKMHITSKTLLFKWKMPLLILSSVFKNVLHWDIFNKIVLKKRLVVKNLQFFKTLMFVLI